jgi:hypothetical protein
VLGGLTVVQVFEQTLHAQLAHTYGQLVDLGLTDIRGEQMLAAMLRVMAAELASCPPGGFREALAESVPTVWGKLWPIAVADAEAEAIASTRNAAIHPLTSSRLN